MLAFIDDEKLDVHEVSFSPRKSNKNTVVFVMEDERTKETHEVEMNLVPSSPNDSASGKIIALIPYSSPGFLSSASEISLVSSSGESPESKAPKSRRLLKKAIILKSKLYPRSPRTKKIIGSPTFKKYNFPSPSQENVRKPLKTLDNWMDEMNNNDAVSLGPEEEEFLDLAVEPSQVPQSQILIEQGKIICKSMKNDLEILKVIDAARFPKQKTPQKQNMSPEQYTESVKETESLREIQNIAIQELIDVLEPIVLLPIESALQFPAPSPSIQSIASSHNDSSILPSASPSNDSSILPPSPIQPVLVSTLDKIMNNSALLREQLNTSIDQMESEIQNSDDRIPEYEKALKIAKIRRETMQKEILESMETLKDGGTNEMMVALVENPLTKERQQVLVELVPTDPSNAPSPGRIVGFFENVESETMPELAPRSMDYSFSEKLTPKRAKHLPNYVTPPKEDDANSTSSEKQAATNNSDPRASKMSANVNKPANIDYNLIENDPNLFDEELELVDDPAEMSAFEQVTKKMHNELVQILDIHSSTLIEEETPNNAPPLENVRKELNFENSLPINSVKEEQAFSQILPNQGYNSSFDLGNIDETGKQFAQLVAITEEQMFNEKSQELINLPNQPSSPVRTLSQPEQESLINFTTPKRSNPVNSKLETQMTDNEIDQLFDEISDELDSLENQTDLLYEFLGTPTQSLKPGQNPFDQFADLVSRVRTSQKLLDDNLISKDSPLGSLIQTGQSPGAQFIQLLPRVLTAEDLISFVDFNGPVQHEQQNIEQAPLVPTQFVPYQNANPNEESITQSPGQCYLQLLPEVLAAEEYLKNACIPSYSTPDQTRDSMQNQSVRSPTKYAQILNQYAAQRDANRSSDRLGQF